MNTGRSFRTEERKLQVEGFDGAGDEVPGADDSPVLDGLVSLLVDDGDGIEMLDESAVADFLYESER
jgi:hypothetical protein